MTLRHIFFVSLLFLIFTILVSSAIAFPVSSNFDEDLDFWTSNTLAEITHVSSGGNPNGYLFFNDTSGERTYVYAPDKFLGDWSSLNGIGTISFDQKVFDTGNINTINPYTVHIVGPEGSGTKATWEGATPPAETTDWFTVNVSVDSSEWSTTGSWNTLLSNVTKMEILMELYNNHGTHKDDIGLDNVTIIPEPATVLLLGLGGLALRRKQRI